MTDPEAALWEALFAAEYDYRFIQTMIRVGPTLGKYQPTPEEVESATRALNDARDAVADYLSGDTR
jgi:hypothetical protein